MFHILRVVLVMVGLVCGSVGAANVGSSDPTGCSMCPHTPPVSKIFDVRDYGAVGDGVTVNTKAIQAAITDAAAKGGGLVTLTDGRYLTGGIVLRDYVYLNVTTSAALIASSSPSDYPQNRSSDWVVVYGYQCRFCGIVGGGVLDGNATPGFLKNYHLSFDQLQPVTWTGPSHGGCKGECRPKLVVFQEADMVLVANVVLHDSADWTSRYFNSTNILITNVTVLGSHYWPNNDGIDPDSSQNITISNVWVETGDDGICPKTTPGALPLHNLLVVNATIRSRSSAIKLGSATAMDMSHMLFSNILVLADTNRGLGIQHRDAGNIFDVEFRDVTIRGTSLNPYDWWGDGEAIWITTIARESGSTVGTVSDIRFVRVMASNVVNGAFLSSKTQTPITKLLIQDSSIQTVPIHPLTLKQGVTYSPLGHDYRPAPNGLDIVPWPLTGLYLEHVNGAVLDTLNLSNQGPWGGMCINGTADSLASLNATNLNCSPK